MIPKPFGFVERLLAEHSGAGLVLDAGCGYAQYRPVVGGRWVGIDLSRSASVIGDLETLPFANRTFGMVFATSAYVVVPDIAAALAEARRVLIPGGRLLVVDFRPWKARQMNQHQPGRFHEWNGRRLRGLVEDAGFTAWRRRVDVRDQPSMWRHVARQIARRDPWLIIDAVKSPLITPATPQASA